MKRKAAVAGHFYPSRAEALKETIGRMVEVDSEKTDAICVISPHAGFEYSGSVAGAVFSSVNLPDKFIILGPNHRHVQSRFAIMLEGAWETPFGDVPIDTILATAISLRTDLISEDEKAHAREHSLEVQLPFIQYFKKDISIVPINFPHYRFALSGNSNRFLHLKKMISSFGLENNFNRPWILIPYPDH